MVDLAVSLYGQFLQGHLLGQKVGVVLPHGILTLDKTVDVVVVETTVAAVVKRTRFPLILTTLHRIKVIMVDLLQAALMVVQAVAVLVQ